MRRFFSGSSGRIMRRRSCQLRPGGERVPERDRPGLRLGLIRPGVDSGPEGVDSGPDGVDSGPDG
eukprot:634763-Pyramimonas_sp.AAC.1